MFVEGSIVVVGSVFVLFDKHRQAKKCDFVATGRPGWLCASDCYHGGGEQVRSGTTALLPRVKGEDDGKTTEHD